MTRQLVIDTDIIRSASETTAPQSIICRRVLEKVRDKKFIVVVTPDVLDEWKRHRSRYSKKWLSTMFARKLVLRLDAEDENLRARVERFADSEKDAEAMLKDIHLLEAALKTDNRVISKNESDRLSFKLICLHIGEIRLIVWVNPEKVEEGCIAWLEADAPDEKHRQLGYDED